MCRQTTKAVDRKGGGSEKEEQEKKWGEREEERLGQRLMSRPVVNQTDTWC